MKKSSLLLTIAAFAMGTHASAQILINELYPGGGASTGAPAYTRDFVELYNTSTTSFSLAGFSLQYASATGNFTNTIVAFGAGSIIGPSDYLSVETGPAGTAGATLTAGSGPGFVTYLAPTSSPGLSASNGSVRLINTVTSVTMDLIGYGTVSVGSAGDPKSEGTAAASPTSTAVSLNRTGFVDTNVNSADFSSMTPTPNAGTTSMVVAVPEPSTWASVVAAIGFLGLVAYRRRHVA